MNSSPALPQDEKNSLIRKWAELSKKQGSKGLVSFKGNHILRGHGLRGHKTMIAKILPGWLETSAAVLLPYGARRLVKGVSASKPRRLRGPRSEEPTRPTD